MGCTSLSFVNQESMIKVTDSSQEVKTRLKTAAETCDEHTPPPHAFVGSCVVPAEIAGERGCGFDNSTISHVWGATRFFFRCMGSNSVLFQDSKLDKLPEISLTSLLPQGGCYPTTLYAFVINQTC
jgi:hypothetical protein